MIVEMNEDREMERFEKLAMEMAYHFDWSDEDREFAENLIADWAVDTQSRNGILLQVAACREFNAATNNYISSRASLYKFSDSAIEFSQKVLRYIYESCPRYEITVYRATDFEGTNALESWTTDRSIAEFYISRNGGGKVIERATDRYLSMWQYGFGLECAREVVVIN